MMYAIGNEHGKRKRGIFDYNTQLLLNHNLTTWDSFPTIAAWLFQTFYFALMLLKNILGPAANSNEMGLIVSLSHA